jgi:uracil-DNA glycosylase
MTLDPAIKNALRERLDFYRELGIGPLYCREAAVDEPPESAGQELELLASLAPTLSPTDGDKGRAPVPVESETGGSIGGDRDALLRVIRDDIGPDCQRCKLARLGRKQIVFGTGDPNAELMFIGEGPGADEDQQGLPFVGRAGQLLNNMIGAMGLKREQVYIANIVKCRPPGNRTPERDECDTCSPFLMRQIRVVRPKVIVALGATAAKNLLGMNDSMASLRGRLYDFSPKRTSPALWPKAGDKGEALVDTTDEPFDCKLAVTYHPAFLLRDPRQKAEAWKDLQKVMKYLGLESPARASKDRDG